MPVVHPQAQSDENARAGQSTYSQTTKFVLALTQTRSIQKCVRKKQFEVGDDAMTHKSERLAAGHEIKEGLHEAGAIDKRTSREFDEASMIPAARSA